jgi:hypothetical protein
LNSDARAAEAEAVVFSFLWSGRAHPDIFEDLSKGGPDFCCEPCGKTKFLVEVTSLESGAVARESSLPARIEAALRKPRNLVTPHCLVCSRSRALTTALACSWIDSGPSFSYSRTL